VIDELIESVLGKALIRRSDIDTNAIDLGRRTNSPGALMDIN
jgi:hypothetical protein